MIPGLLDPLPAPIVGAAAPADVTLPRRVAERLRTMVEEAETVVVDGAPRTVVDLDDGDRARLLVALDASLRGGGR